MITVRLQGGLGNQLFQYAFARSIATNRRLTFSLDTSLLSKSRAEITLRYFELSFFNYQGKIEKKRSLSLLKFISRNKWIASLFRLPYYYKEIPDTYDENFLNLPPDTVYEGYWQCYKYFQNISKILMDDLDKRIPLSSASELSLKKIISSHNSVAIHIRRGDYLTNPAAIKFHGALSMDYYSESISRVLNYLDKTHFFVFSDDPEWCKKNIKFKSNEVTFISHNTGANSWQDLILMSYCNHHIIANSSFSWWGAWMADQRHGVKRTIFAPKRWFYGADTNSVDRFPQHWNLV